MILGTTTYCSSQTYAFKDHYLIDSLDLAKLSKGDSILLETCLRNYHSAKDDTSRINAINTIVEECWDNKVWPKYNTWVYEFVNEKFKSMSTERHDTSVLILLFKKKLAGALNNMGYINSKQGDIPKALYYYHESLEIEEEIDNKKGMAIAYNNIGSIHYKQQDVQRALQYYHKSLQIEKDIRYYQGMSNSYNNIGLIHHRQGETSLALEYYNKSLIIQEESNDKKGLAQSYNNIGGIYKNLAGNSNPDSISYRQHHLGIALEFYQKSLMIKEEIDDKHGMSISYKNIGQIALDQGVILGDGGALSMTKKSLEIAQEIGYPRSIKFAAALLSAIYEKQGNHKKALEMRNLEIQMRDSLASEEAIKAIAKQEAKYEYEKQKALDDKENEKTVAIEKQKQKNQFIVLVVVFVGAAMVAMLLVIIYRRLRITSKQKVLIEHQHEEIQDSISYAKRIQTAILPPESFLKEHLPNNFVYYLPKDVVAGDFYWLEHHDGIVFIAAADCTSYGVPGAMVSVVCHNALNRAVREFGLRDTGKILDKVRELVLITFEKSEEQMKDGMDICLCAWHKKENQLQYAGANNPLYLVRHCEPDGNQEKQSVQVDEQIAPLPMVVRNDMKLETIKGTKQPIGHVDKIMPFKAHNIDLKDIHSFYLTTDGFADQFGGPKNKKFTYKKLRDMLLVNSSKLMIEQHDILKSELDLWIEQGDDEQIDDICMIGVKV